MKNIFLDLNCLQGDKVIISDENYHYLKNVRRIRKGNTLDAVIGDGKYQLVVSNIGKKNLECDIVVGRNIISENIVRIQVFQGLLKAKKMDFVVSKLSELGVEALFPLNTSRSVPVVDPGGNRTERWRKIAAEGSKISGIETVMQVKNPVDISRIGSDIKSEEFPIEGKHTLVVFSTSYTDCHIKQLLDTLDNP
jgi:16S rRNA (uracil1498-N3)-methyltransferase